MTMLQTYPGALWRPLSENNTAPSLGIPRLLIWHTMVGYLRSTETMFRRNGYTGVESTFGLGGEYDPDGLDGTIYQWQMIGKRADAQASGNPYANSIECSDGGDSERPFSAKQVEANIRLGVWWCRQTNNRPVKANSWNGYGFGYHRMFPQWNPDSHSCPGNRRARQLETEIWPEIASVLVTKPSVPAVLQPANDPLPAFPLRAGDYYGRRNNSGIPYPEVGLFVWQRQMVARGWDINVNGQYTEVCERVCKQFQAEKRLTPDGLLGAQTWAAAWRAPVT